MPTKTTLERIDTLRAAMLACATEDICQPHITVIAHGEGYAGYRGVYAQRGADAAQGLVITAPPEYVRILTDALAAESPARAFSIERLCSPLGDAVERVVGPASLAYADDGDFRPSAASVAVRLLTSDDASAFRALRDACDAAEWESAGIELDRNPIYAAFDGHVLAAASSWEDRGGAWNIGVVTHPQRRGRGYGRAAASVATQHALREGALPQWQTLIENAPSLAIGRARIRRALPHHRPAAEVVGAGGRRTSDRAP